MDTTEKYMRLAALYREVAEVYEHVAAHERVRQPVTWYDASKATPDQVERILAGDDSVRLELPENATGTVSVQHRLAQDGEAWQPCENDLALAHSQLRASKQREDDIGAELVASRLRLEVAQDSIDGCAQRVAGLSTEVTRLREREAALQTEMERVAGEMRDVAGHCVLATTLHRRLISWAASMDKGKQEP